MPEDDVPTSTENKSEMMKGRMENSEAHRIRRFTCSGCVKCISCQSFKSHPRKLYQNWESS